MNTMIKVCGMTDADNIRDVEVLGVDMIGFIFYPKSPRYLYQIPRYLPTLAKRVGVFVNETKEKHPYVCRPFRSELRPAAR